MGCSDPLHHVDHAIYQRSPYKDGFRGRGHVFLGHGMNQVTSEPGLHLAKNTPRHLNMTQRSPRIELAPRGSPTDTDGPLHFGRGVGDKTGAQALIGFTQPTKGFRK